jgi:catechol 2,3-dioxygenase-like lactoylglutathione lyase family enzyme
MAETTTPPRIAHGATVIFPVTDQERALAFYVEALGFEKVSDFRYDDGERWLEVAPPGESPIRLSLVAQPDAADAGIETRIAFGVDDIEAAHAALRARGADVDERILREGDPAVRWAGATLAGIPPMFLVRDPDANSFLLVQTS